MSIFNSTKSNNVKNVTNKFILSLRQIHNKETTNAAFAEPSIKPVDLTTVKTTHRKVPELDANQVKKFNQSLRMNNSSSTGNLGFATKPAPRRKEQFSSEV